MDAIGLAGRRRFGTRRVDVLADAYFLNGVAAAGSDRPAIQSLDTVCHYALLALVERLIGTEASNFRRFAVVITGLQPRTPSARYPRPRAARSRSAPECARTRGRRTVQSRWCVLPARRRERPAPRSDRDGSDWPVPAHRNSAVHPRPTHGSGAGYAVPLDRSRRR